MRLYKLFETSLKLLWVCRRRKWLSRWATWTDGSVVCLLIFLVALRPLFCSRYFPTLNLLLKVLFFGIELAHHIYFGLQIFMKGLGLSHVEIVDMIDCTSEGIKIAMEIIPLLIISRIEGLQKRIKLLLGRDWKRHFKFIILFFIEIV